MSGLKEIMKNREQELKHSVVELEWLCKRHKDNTQFLSQEAYKLGLKYAIRQIEGTELLHVKMMKEAPFANPEEALREHKNQMNTLGTLKSILIRRFEGKP